MAALGASPTLATPEMEEYNLKVTHQNWVATLRHADVGKHVELGKTIAGVEWMYRYADLLDTDEHRLKISHRLWRNDYVALSHRLEYRAFTAETLEDHWRYRLILDYQLPLTEHMTFWVKLQPRVAFRDDDNTFDARDQIGLRLAVSEFVSVSPFFERQPAGHYQDVNTYVIGAHVHWKW